MTKSITINSFELPSQSQDDIQNLIYFLKEKNINISVNSKTVRSKIKSDLVNPKQLQTNFTNAIDLIIKQYKQDLFLNKIMKERKTDV